MEKDQVHNVYTNTTTNEMKPPEDWDHTAVKIDPLYVTHGNIGKHQLFATYWQPSPEELAILNAGGAIEVLLLGSQAPMQVQVQPLTEVAPVDIHDAVTEPQ